jgi:hypothetical protein
MKYIDAVIKGTLEPAGNYIDENEIDYAGAIYSVTYKPDLVTPVLTTKAIGTFPVSLSSKEAIGSRSDNQVAISSITYKAAKFEMESGKGGLYGQFLSDIQSKL